MLITKDFLKDIPPSKKDAVLQKTESFSRAILQSRNMFDVPNGFWVRRVAGTDIYKFRINNGDRVLFAIQKERGEDSVVFLRYCNHDQQIRAAREIDRNVEHIQPLDFELVTGRYDEDETDYSLESEYASYLQLYAHADLSQLAAIVLEDEYIALLLDENNEDYLYYLNDDQFDCLNVLNKPLLVCGSAGSGKSMIGMRRLVLNNKAQVKTAYVTHSNLLKENTQALFEKFKDADNRVVDFFTIHEYGLQQLGATSNQLVKFSDFDKWHKSSMPLWKHKPVDSLRAWFEISGILKGSRSLSDRRDSSGLLSEADYMASKESILEPEEKKRMFPLARMYNRWLKDNGYLDENDLARLCLEKRDASGAGYDFVVIDEVQDLSELQMELLFTLAKSPEHYLLLGDANQSLRGGFTGMARLKTRFYEKCQSWEERRLTKNYRSVSGIVHLLNKLTELRESHIGKSAYDYEEAGIRHGNRPLLLQFSAEDRRRLFDQLNERDYCAVVVAGSEDRDRMLLEGYPIDRIFTIHEMKGLEYKNVLMVNILSNYAAHWDRIVKGGAKNNDFYRLFYNLVYVAATRARDQLYIVEDQADCALLPLLMPFLDASSRFDYVQLQLEKETTVQEWIHEAIRLEKAELYHKAMEIYWRLGDQEGEDRCKARIKDITLQYLQHQLGVAGETAIRIEHEDGGLGYGEIHQALLALCLRHGVTFSRERIQCAAYTAAGQQMLADVKVQAGDDIISVVSFQVSRIIAPASMSKRKLTLHLKLSSGDAEVQIPDLDGAVYDTVYATYTSHELAISYAKTMNPAMEQLMNTVFPEMPGKVQNDQELIRKTLLFRHSQQAASLFNSRDYRQAVNEYEKAL
ncbi:MAG: family ATPase, partial [Paenibacillaceae bacterium]|nr:family ATPase [Paenibacillaceae bacterium]